MAKFAHDTLKVKKVAVLRDVRNDYSVGLANAFVEAYGKIGGKVVADESYSQGDVDFKAQLTNIKATSPEAILVPGYYNDVGLIARQVPEVGMTVPMLCGDGSDTQRLSALDGPA